MNIIIAVTVLIIVNILLLVFSVNKKTEP